MTAIHVNTYDMKFSLNELRELVNEAIRKAYELLGVSPGASPEEIKSAYRKQAIALHPDRNAGQDTGPKMAQLNVAYGLLSNPEKRKTYDVMGDKTLGDYGSSGSSQPRSNPSSAQNPWSNWAQRAQQAADAQKKEKQARSQARADAEDRDRRARPSGPPTAKRTFHFISGSSRKKWSIYRRDNVVFVEYGRLGFLGRVNKSTFGDWAEAADFVNKKVAEKIHKGYKEVMDPGAGSAQQPPPRPASGPSASPKTPRPGSPSGKKATYKVYGRRPGGPAHTRHKGKVYVAGKDTKFRSGDQANVEVGPDGELKVKNPATGHSQSWKAESLEAVVDMMLFEMYSR